MAKAENTMPLVALIIPVHNPGAYLTACLESVINQRYSNLEILLVDDDSTDGSKDIINEYTNKDSRVKYYFVNHHNAALTRRDGVRRATADYVCFVDSDDIIREDYVDVLYRALSGSKAGLAVAKMCMFRNEKDLSSKHQDSEAIHIEQDTLAYFCDNYRVSMTGTFVAQTMAAKMFIRQSLRVLDFSVIKTSVLEDNYVISQILHRLTPRKIAMVDSTIYFYRQNQNSTMSGVLTRTIAYGRKYITYPQLFEKTAAYLKSLYDDYGSRLDERINKLKAEEFYGVAEALTGQVFELKNQNKHLTDENARLTQLVHQKTEAFEALLNSKTYKAGKLVTQPARIVKRAVRPGRSH